MSMIVPISLICCALFLGGAAVIAAADEPVADTAAVDFGRRLEPAGRRVIHGAGQDLRTFIDYAKFMGDAPPLIYMSYMGVNGDPARRIGTIRAEVEQAEREIGGGIYLVPQIGVSMTRDGQPEQRYEHRVAAGEFDDNLDDMCRALREWGRPVYLRIGYEFNGSWNGYEPDTYRAAFRRITEKLREHGLDDVATVWNWAPMGREDYMPFYPGDDVVDWWSLDILSDDQFDTPATEAFMAEALRRRFPVMIGEATPRGVGVLEGQRSIDRWFAPYFAFIARHPHLKATCYINWDWAKYPQWRDWGDARVEQNEAVLAYYRRQMNAPLFLNGGDERHARSALDATPSKGETRPSR